MNVSKKNCLQILFFPVLSGILLNVVVFPLWAVQGVFQVGSSEDFFNIKSALVEYKSLNGVAPNDEVFFALVFDPKYSLSDVDQFGLWDELVKIQTPRITKENLRSLVLAKRSSIKDFYGEFTVIHENSETKNDSEVGVTGYKYAYKNNLFFVERQRGNDHSRIAFSGELFIKVWLHPSLQANILYPPESLHNGFVPMMPFFQIMIADTGMFHTDHQGFDLVRLLEQNKNLCIFEKKEVIGGREYLVLGNFTKRLLLDINKDFSVYQLSDYSFQNDPSKSNRVIDRSKGSVRTLVDLTDYGNGIWLPKKSENLYFSEKTGKVIMSDVVTYGNIKLNQGLEADFFVDVIPEDALVTDSIRDMVYVFSDRASIDDLLKATAKSKRVFIFQYISVTAGIIMIIIALIMMYLKRRKNSE
jgi:hypothetical protein